MIIKIVTVIGVYDLWVGLPISILIFLLIITIFIIGRIVRLNTIRHTSSHQGVRFPLHRIFLGPTPTALKTAFSTNTSFLVSGLFAIDVISWGLLLRKTAAGCLI